MSNHEPLSNRWRGSHWGGGHADYANWLRWYANEITEADASAANMILDAADAIDDLIKQTSTDKPVDTSD